MSDDTPTPDAPAAIAPVRTRRPPPPFREVTVRRTEMLSSRMVRVTFCGDDLAGFTVDQPGASVRFVVPWPGDAFVVPRWTGNEFLLADGRRPALRTFTPGRVDLDALETDLDIVLHGSGAISQWAASAAPGDAAAISGPGRGYPIEPGAPGFLVVGDESAIPAIRQLLTALPDDRPVRVSIEVVEDEARQDLPAHPSATVDWRVLPAGDPPGTTVVDAVIGADIPEGTRIWAAGEAAAMQRIRRHLFEVREVPRPQTWVRGYWKHGAPGDADELG